MSLTPVGYTGTVDAVQDAKRSQFQGAVFPAVATRAALVVSINGAASLTCNVSAGVAWAHGVMATLDAAESVTFDSVTTLNATRWDAVVIRRNWTAGTAVLAVVKGTAAASASQVLPPGLNGNPGVLHDQVLALVRIANGQNLPTLVVDMRMWASKVFTAPSLAALPVPNATIYGAEAVLTDGIRYRCVLDGSSNFTWTEEALVPPEITSGPAVISPATNWSTSSIPSEVIVDGYQVTLDIDLRRTGPQIVPDDRGGIGSTFIAKVADGFRPSRSVDVRCKYYGGAATPTTYGVAFGDITVEADGDVFLHQLTPSIPLNQKTASDFGSSLRAHLTYARKVI